jgi:hypothetical protein
MKTTILSAITRKFLLGFITFMLLLILPLSLQAKKIPFAQSTVVPAAEGYVKINTDRNNNNIIKIRIKYLAEIERLDPTMKTYVVWMVTNRETTINIGRINSSNSLNVNFEAVSSFKPVRIFITAEENESTQVPAEKIVLTTDNFWK